MSDGILVAVYENGNVEYYLGGWRQQGVDRGTGVGGINTTMLKVVLIYFINDIITPNGDGIDDDVFKMNTTVANPIELYVYTPSGERVYYSKSYDNSWGGDVKGKLLSFGNYFYLVIDKKEGISRKGVLYIKTIL